MLGYSYISDSFKQQELSWVPVFWPQSHGQRGDPASRSNTGEEISAQRQVDQTFSIVNQYSKRKHRKHKKYKKVGLSHTKPNKNPKQTIIYQS